MIFQRCLLGLRYEDKVIASEAKVGCTAEEFEKFEVSEVNIIEACAHTHTHTQTRARVMLWGGN